MEPWIDFELLKRIIPIQSILQHYRINWLKTLPANRLVGRCPFHGGGDGCFCVSLERNLFNCFSCDAHGTVLDFVARMEQCSVREAALRIMTLFKLPEMPRPTTEPAEHNAGRAPAVVQPNTPLSFSLRNLDHSHPYLIDRCIHPATAAAFGVGFYADKGLHQGRIVIPIHNAVGQIVAYAGRVIDGSTPKYIFPPRFRKSLELFNYHRAAIHGRAAIVVEGFFDTMRLHQAGLRPVVGLMGCSMSEQQMALLARGFDKVFLMLDGDEAGVRATRVISEALRRCMIVEVLPLPLGRQPDSLSADEILELLEQAIGSTKG